MQLCTWFSERSVSLSRCRAHLMKGMKINTRMKPGCSICGALRVLPTSQSAHNDRVHILLFGVVLVCCVCWWWYVADWRDPTRSVGRVGTVRRG